MEGKKSFILYSDLINVVDKLPDDMAGKLFKIILKYVNDKEVCIDDILLEIAFEPVKQQLKRDLEKWNSLKEKRSEAGKRGGRPKKEEKQTEANKVNALFDNQSKANKAVNDTVNDTVNDNVLLEKETKEIENKTEVDILEENREELVKIPEKIPQKKKFRPPDIQEVQEYCNERQNGVSAYSFVNFYQSKGWKIGNQSMKDWKAAIHTWEQKRKDENNEKKQKTETDSGVVRRKRIS